MQNFNHTVNVLFGHCSVFGVLNLLSCVLVLTPLSLLQANPDPNTCLGVFGLSLYTTERDLREVFSRYGPLAGVNVVYDQRTGRSRGFAFVYFERIDDAKEVHPQLEMTCQRKFTVLSGLVIHLMAF